MKRVVNKGFCFEIYSLCCLLIADFFRSFDVAVIGWGLHGRCAEKEWNYSAKCLAMQNQALSKNLGSCDHFFTFPMSVVAYKSTPLCFSFNRGFMALTTEFVLETLPVELVAGPVVPNFHQYLLKMELLLAVLTTWHLTFHPLFWSGPEASTGSRWRQSCNQTTWNRRTAICVNLNII